MALDFPASPKKGDRYTPTGGPAYVFDGVVWIPAPAGSSLKPAVMPHCIACRNVGQEILAMGAQYGIIGSFTFNIGGFNGGSLIGGSGLGVVIPKAGTYLMKNRTYYNPGTGSAPGRLQLTVNGVSNNNFIQLPLGAAGALTQEAWTINDLNAGDQIGYYVGVATIIIYTATGHSEVELYRLPDGWEKAA